MLQKIKVHEIAKNLELTSKDITAILEKYGISVKYTTVLEEKQLDIIFEALTQKYDKGGEFNIPNSQLGYGYVEPVKEVKKEVKEEVKPSDAKVENKNNKKPDKKEFKREPGRKEKDKKKPEYIEIKGSGKDVDTPKKEKEAVVYNTRSEAIDVSRIEKVEKLEELVSDKMKDNVQTKQKIKKGNKFQKPMQKQMLQQKPKNIPKPVQLEIDIPETISVGELASRLKKTAVDVIKKLMGLGQMASVSDVIDFDTAAIIAEEFGAKYKKEVIITAEDSLLLDIEDNEEDLKERPPVVVVMGHVDHGKTSLLDAIRNTHVTDGEAGGITQHIGAYQVTVNERKITFLDTPGHEAFTAMRARGAQVTDIAILVVAADDGIMPQTIESINHAKAAGISIIVAINKMDKETADPDRVKQQLAEHEVIPEEWGGDTICVPVSAKKGDGITELLEMVNLVADMKELKANPDRKARGTVIESKLDKGRGPVATILVQHGTLKIGDVVVAGTAFGKVRAMIDEKGRRVKEAGPSVPVEILGLSSVPDGGDMFYVVEDERKAREVVDERVANVKLEAAQSVQKASLESLFDQIEQGKMKQLNIIIKADVQGSVEAVKQSLEKITNEEVKVCVIHGAVGAVNESDVMLASASNAIIVGFNVRPDSNAMASAERAGVQMKLYRVIYDAIEEITAAMKGMLDPKFQEVVQGHAEIRQTFKVSSIGTIGGSYVLDGKISRNSQVRIVRDGIVIHEGVLSSLKRFKDDVKEVASGYECGIGIENYNDIKDGDIVESFIMEEIKQ
ncbi:MAG: translation initiation factor IF-2 [Clostridia bacterium]|nr:translation initiation factor IF-2 [Clostridia bacterium]